MFVTIIVVALFVFKAPNYVWLSIPICFAYFFLKFAIKQAAHREKKIVYEWDEFDWWQDNQGL